ncbi:DUF4430 domain-containing protein [Vagococcus intermedius]|uniref:DUF4430 domain-containing protein n=1 Tax=Vagococcus intermedius TaxID=2991418 RepID=A0AAF0CWC4_9ENTE|nr:DUF4430 domain-containing protein [Vagococcus intermedius]WEG74184.1 DUF4430 domain-containing protein [Vagococcus intermedius]WEG76264.1 DUF4430 domain-containing protein [Vagococcus intermedius]
MKNLTKLMMVALAGLALAGCGKQEEAGNKTDSSAPKTEQKATKSDKEEGKFKITLNEDDKEITSKELSFKEGDFLQDVMENEFDILEENGMISAIDGHEKNDKEQKYWLYEVNGEQPTVGAKEYKLKDGDKIVFDLKKLDM